MDPEVAKHIEGITTAQVVKIGNSLGVVLTKPLKLMNIKEGDTVLVSFKKV